MIILARDARLGLGPEKLKCGLRKQGEKDTPLRTG